MEKLKYNKTFYSQQRSDNLSSAKVIVPKAIGYLREVYGDTQLSVIDLGCGSGNWLSVFKNGGVAVTGVDGGDIPADLLMIANNEFISHDFRTPYKSNKKYSLAMSLECAEHVPESNADEIIDSLVSLSDIVMFSAAIPHQRGKGHINEQYQTYWIRKFNERGYQELDVIRPQVWDDVNVRGFYAENIFIYVKRGTEEYEKLKKYEVLNRTAMYNVVHPQVWENVNDYKVVRMMDNLHENRFISWFYYKFLKK